MLSLLSIVCLGFFLGMRHATDADHVIAVSTIVSRERAPRKAAWLGAVWGLGHTFTVMIVGGAIVFFGLVIPPRLGLSLEFSVGVMLVLLGFWNLKTFNRGLRPLFRRAGNANEIQPHSHPHQHGDYVHDHPHGHDLETHGHAEHETPQARLDSCFGGLLAYQAIRPLVVGVVHGLAGSAAVALLVLPIIQNPAWAVAYLALFGVGTIAGMMLVTAAIAWPLSSRAGRSGVLQQRLGLAAGYLSVGFGAFMIYEIGFVQGLFIK